MLSDIRNAVRMMDRNRWFTAVVIGVLALGIGANTAIFSVVESVMLRPLPFRSGPPRVFVWETSPKSSTRIGPSGPNYLDFKEQNTSFDDMAALEVGSGTITEFGEPQQYALRVSTNYLAVLGIRPTRGRDFQIGEGWNDRLVIVSYGFWERNLGLAPDVIGRRLMVDDLPYVIIGVTPKTFWSPVPSELLVPWSAADLRARNGTNHDFGVVGRLRHGVLPQGAAAELTAIERRIAQGVPAARMGRDGRTAAAPGRRKPRVFPSRSPRCGRARVGDRVREHREPSARPGHVARTRDSDSPRPGCEPATLDAAVSNGECATRYGRRRGRSSHRALGRRLVGSRAAGDVDGH